MQRSRDRATRRSLQQVVATPLVRMVWGRLLRWRFFLFQRHRYDRLVLERVANRPILVLPEVFNPQLMRTGAFFAQQLDGRLVPPGTTVLDMGTGSGVCAVFAAQHTNHVVAVDINPAAVRCARINALLNGVESRVEVLAGDLFAPVMGRRFDLVLFNPPFFRGKARGGLDHAWRSDDTVERFAAALHNHLAPGGRALVLLSTDGETPAFLQAFRNEGLAATIFAERELINERLTIYEIKPF